MIGMPSENLVCIFCGSPEIEEIRLHKLSSDSPRALGAQFMGSGANYKGKHGASSDLFFETHFCKKCKKAEAKGSVNPAIVWLNDNNGYHLEVLLPESLLTYFDSIDFGQNEIIESIMGIGKRLKQVIGRFEKTGINPCKNGKHGFRAKLNVYGNKVEVYVLVENNGTGKYARIVYDGGRSFCE